MSREIKFRAWEKINKVMHLDFRFIKSGDEGNDWLIFTSDKQNLQGNPHPFDNPWFQQQFEIMQFTGLKDVNGVEIYEGDIVKGVGEHEGQSEVFYDHGRWQPFSYLGSFNGNDYEVIGDWRNTLEQRPSHIGEAEEKSTLNFDLEMDIAKTYPALALHLAKEKLETYQDNKAKLGESDWYDYDKQEATKLPPVGIECEAQGKVSVGYRSFCKVKVIHHGVTKTVLESMEGLADTRKGDCVVFETLKLQFRPLDWNRNLQPNPEPEPSPELSFHLSNAFNELQASARLLPDTDPRRAQIVALAGGVSAVKEVVGC